MYPDTVVIIKLLFNKADSALFHDALEEQILSSSELTFAKLYSAPLAEERSGQITRSDRDAAGSLFSGRLQFRESTFHPLNDIAIRKADSDLACCQPHVLLGTLDAASKLIIPVFLPTSRCNV